MITVVIPLYNKASTIIRCLESVYNQKELPDELIIINDGSQDNSLKIVNNWLALNDKIKFQMIDQINHGVSYTRNKGVSLSRNNFVAFLDADDQWCEDFLYNVKQVILNNQDISLVTCKHKINDKVLGTFIPKQDFGNKEFGIIENYCFKSRNSEIVNSSKVVVNKFYFEKVGGFPIEAIVAEDLYLWIKLSYCAPIAYINKLLVIVNQEPDLSRKSRVGQVPYPIIYYSSLNNNDYMDRDLFLYLWSIHVKHVLGSLALNKNEALKRILYGLKLFKIKGFLLFGLLLIPKITYKKIRIFRRKYFIKQYGSK